jgi:hypothetical protein
VAEAGIIATETGGNIQILAVPERAGFVRLVAVIKTP